MTNYAFTDHLPDSQTLKLDRISCSITCRQIKTNMTDNKSAQRLLRHDVRFVFPPESVGVLSRHRRSRIVYDKLITLYYITNITLNTGFMPKHQFYFSHK